MTNQSFGSGPTPERKHRSDFSHFLPRLRREFYQADAVVFWTMPLSHRAQGWLDDRFHAGFREMMLHTAAREVMHDKTAQATTGRIANLKIVFMTKNRDSTESQVGRVHFLSIRRAASLTESANSRGRTTVALPPQLSTQRSTSSRLE